jgi:iron complex outermembrane recepter protein
MKSNKVRSAVVLAIAAQAGVFGAPAFAQESGGLEEIVVTATRRALDVQEVPAAITAIGGESLERQNIEGLEDLSAVVPNVLLAGDNGGTTGASLYMRGIPNVGVYLDGIWQVSNNGLLTRDFVELDRIEVLRGPQGTLYGRDSTGGAIQIHSKKPGKEFGGTVSMQVGNLDRRDLVASVDIPIGDKIFTKFTMGDYSVDGWVKSLTTGINDGYMDSQVRRADILWTPTDKLSLRFIHQEDDQVGRQARVQARIDFNVAYYHGYQVGIAEAHNIASGGKFNPNYAVAGYPGGKLGRYESRISSTSPNEQYMKQNTLHVDYDITDNMHVKYMYGDSLVDASIYNDWGGSEYNFFVNYDTSRLDLKSHEFQLTGDLFQDKLEYVVGFYKWKQDGRNRGVEWSMQDWTLASNANNGTIQTLDYNTVLNSPACQRRPSDVGFTFPGNVWPVPCNAFGGNGWIGLFGSIVAGNFSDRLNGGTQDGRAIFGEVTWHVTDAWDLTFGYRDHQQDNVAYSMSPAKLASNIASGATEARPKQLDNLFTSRRWATSGPVDTFTPVSFGDSTIRIATTYDISPDIMLYAGYSEGFNSGGISQYADSVGPVKINYAPEQIENMEVGLRADLFNRTLRTNITAFKTDWLGIQYLGTVIDRGTGQEATELVLQNTADGQAKGVELEATWLATDALQIGANIGLLKTKYLSINPGAPLPKDSDFARAPEKTYSFNAQYEFGEVMGGELTGRVSSNYMGCYWRATTLELRQDYQGLVDKCGEAGDVWQHNARLTWVPAGGKYEVAIWGNNLTDTYNYNSGFMHGIWQFDFATVDRPREYGIQFKAKF